MTISFTKMHGAGNDFIIIDDRNEHFPDHDAAFVRQIAGRRTGIGCEGVIIVRSARSDAECDYRMVFLNPDGSRASMCGNATRCLALFAFNNGTGGRIQRIGTDVGIVVAEVLEARAGAGTVCVQMPPPHGRRESVLVPLPDGRIADCFYVNTGVPHAVVFADDVAAVNVAEDGRTIRMAEAFAPDGTNVDFVQIMSDGPTRVRTYERGVEAESGACGTGAAAVGVAMAELRKCPLPVSLQFSLREILVIDGQIDASGQCHGVCLTGPAQSVFEGRLQKHWISKGKP